MPQNTTWEQIGNISPLIPHFQDVIRHIAENVNYSLSASWPFLLTIIILSCLDHRALAITRPQGSCYDLDLNSLINSHRERRLFDCVPGCKLHNKRDCPKDFLTLGTWMIRDSAWLEEYAARNTVYYDYQADEEIYSDHDTPPDSPLHTPPPSRPPTPHHLIQSLRIKSAFPAAGPCLCWQVCNHHLWICTMARSGWSWTRRVGDNSWRVGGRIWPCRMYVT